MLTFHIITLFPDTITPYLKGSILGRAQKNKYIAVKLYNPMEETEVLTRGALPQRVDARPYGGGPGMVLRAEPIMRSVKKAIGRKKNVGFIHFKPRAELFSNNMAHQIALESVSKRGPIRDIVIICGRYEGVDSRINEMFPGREISIGDYVLTGGELPALVVIDAVTRQIPGVLGDTLSLEDEREDAPGKYYTRPETLQYKKKKYHVPQVLLSGDHKKISRWRKDNN